MSVGTPIFTPASTWRRACSRPPIILDAASETRERLEQANGPWGRARSESLAVVDGPLARLRLHLRPAVRRNWLTSP